MPADIFTTDSATIFSRCEIIIAGRLVKRSDLKSIRFTVFETESLQSNVREPLPEFENIDVPIDTAFTDEIQTYTVNVDIGGAGVMPRQIDANCRVIVSPFVRTSGDQRETIYPFRTRGMFYVVVITFEFNDPTIAPFTHPEEIRAV